jgi:hypothetical protein
MGLAYGGAIVRDGLVLALDAADRNSYPGTGTTWYDLSPSGYTFTTTSVPTFTTNNRGVSCFDFTNGNLRSTPKLQRNQIKIRIIDYGNITFPKNSKRWFGFGFGCCRQEFVSWYRYYLE